MIATTSWAVAASLSWLLAAATPHPSAPWEPGGRVEWALAPGEVRRHAVMLDPGQFVRVTVAPAGIDVVVRTYGPDGLPGPEVDASEGPHGWELASILATATGEHSVEVKAHPDARRPGRYVLESDAVRPAEARDHRRLVAEEARARSAPGLGPRAAESKRGQPSASGQQAATRNLPIAAEIFHELGETCLEAESLTFLALVLGWSNKVADILEMHPRAMELWERCDDPYKRAEAHIYAAEGYRIASQYQRAAETMERGLAMARTLGARDLEMLLLTNLGGTHNLLGNTEESIRSAEEVLPILRAMEIPQGEAVALRNLALAHIRRGDFQRAADLAQESLDIRRRIGDWPGEVTTLITLGEVYLLLGEPAAARRYLDDALAIAYPKPGARIAWPRLLTSLARAHEQMGDRARALEALEKSLAHHQASDHRQHEPTSLVMLGRFHLAGRAFDQALEAGSEATRLLRPSGERYWLAEALELQGTALLGLGEAANARGSLEESLGLRRLVQDLPGEAAALQHLARIDLARGDPESARRRLEESLQLVETARARIVSPELRSTWLARVRSVHETYVDALMDLHRRDAGAGWDVKAFEASEWARARSLLDLLAESCSDIRTGVDPELLSRERSLRERLGAHVERHLRVSGASNSAEREGLAREIHSLSTEYENLRARLRAASPRYAALTQPARLGLEDVRSQVLDSETLLLEYSLGAERSYLWVVGRDVFAAYDLPSQAEIEDAVVRVRAATSRRRTGEEGDDALATLARMLIAPAAGHLANQRLLFVADGPLHHLAFAALPDASGRPLVTSHEIVSAPSASVLALLRKAEGTRLRPTRTLAVLADPVFDREDRRVHSRTPVAVASNAALERATRDFGFEGGRLPRLPFTRREAQSILSLAPAGSRRLALDFDASRATLTDPELKDYRVVHFATHGLLNDVRPELSGLVLSLVDERGRDRSGLLLAPDVFNLELNAELVVLSGCRTALGKEVRGEGLVGLTRAFMYAGVPRVVASLWPVEDLATAELMKRFYEGMLGPLKLRPAAALRRAQAQMAGHRRWSEPYYWAGFTLQGDWR